MKTSLLKSAKLLLLLAFFSTCAMAQDNWLDTTFATGGRFKQDSIYTYCTLTQSDGKILLGGAGWYKNYFAVMRLNQEGTIDSLFETRGYAIDQTILGFPTSSWARIVSMVQQSDGKILAAGMLGGTDVIMEPVAAATVLMRYNIDGSIDTAFGDNGYVIVHHDNLWRGKTASVVIDTAGKIFLANLHQDDFGSPYYIRSRTRIACYDTLGQLDTTYGVHGTVFVPSSSLAFVTSCAIQHDGKMLLGGSDSSNANFFIARYLSVGSLDSSFGTYGIASTNCGPDTGTFSQLLVLNDGSILAVKIPTPFLDHLSFSKFVRFTSAGHLDPAFGQSGCGGLVTSVQGIAINDGASYMAEYTDGKLLVGQNGSIDSSQYVSHYYVVPILMFTRYLQNGSVDSSFGKNGIVTSSLEAHTQYEQIIRGIFLLPDGRFTASTEYKTMRYLDSATATGILGMNEFHILIYPNPATDRVFIDPSVHDFSISVSDMAGREYHVQEDRGKLDVSALSEGVYLIRIQNKDGVYLRKFLKIQ
ncbi:MAG: type sorting protein [Patescibacteria group bacterium]|nr:type sorting protein [Patescibacteria group bacterium]